ncbi:hypothetical protein K474DRAFT_1678288 [Panus rudis PR-1116 ss-1]|nr:hypothetical protein K474DRAFT_1678288 [Panus rudis PR-1116 ss-1]
MDVFGIGAVYIIENAQQFWSELEEILHIPPDCTLERLDNTLKSFISLCATYHEQYLQSPLQLEHSCDLVLQSELFQFHSERMCELLLKDAQETTDPHTQLIVYNILLSFGKRRADFLRSHKRWKPIIPLLMDHVMLDIDPDIDDAFIGGSTSGSNSGSVRGIAVPIEVKLRSLSVRLLYEVCRVQKLSLHDLELFHDAFIDHLFDLVEQTRDQQDETFNYSVIKLIVALNEQFMVASLHPETPRPDATFHRQQDPPGSSSHSQRPEAHNRILRVLMSRLSSSMTFGENLIFMLNRANRTPEDLVMQLLVLKLLYLLFNTKGTSEYFYTNDLCVLVDVFLREIVNLDEENESLRHTYLRVLHPLLTKTQLRSMPYKRPQIVRVLESLIENENIRDVNPTTKRLVQRCLSGEWCVQFRKNHRALSDGATMVERVDSPGLDTVSVTSAPQLGGTRIHLEPPAGAAGHSHGHGKPPPGKTKTLKSSRSAENLKLHPPPHRHRPAQLTDSFQQMGLGNGSSSSLPRVAETSTSSLKAPDRPHRTDSATAELPSSSMHERKSSVLEDTTVYTQEPLPLGVDISSSTPEIRVFATSPISTMGENTSSSSSCSTNGAYSASPTRRAPPAPPKRRKAPAIPSQATSAAKHGKSGLLTSSASQPVLSPLGAESRKL